MAEIGKIYGWWFITMAKKQTKRQWYHTNNKVLLKWIISGCVILLIPMTCIIINFLYTKDLLTQKINESNRVTLSSTRYTIDNRLQSLLDISKYITLNSAFSNKTLNTSSHELFINKMITCKQVLNNYKQINPDIDILVYFPNRNFIITPDTANDSKNIYDSISTNLRNQQDITFQQWNALLDERKKNQFFIDSKFSYRNFGIDSIVFSSNSAFIYEDKNKFNIYTSIPCSFIDEILNDNQNSVVCIINKDGTILKQLGSNTSFSVPMEQLPIEINANFGFTTFEMDNKNYMCSFEMSSIYDWYYAIYTPTSVYLQASIHLRNVSLLTIGLTLLLGVCAIIYLQLRNYRPLSKLVSRIPLEIKKSEHNEFDLIETYYQSLYEENESMKTTIQSRQSHAKEVYLLSKLKGRRSHLSDSDISEYLDWEQENKYFALASFSLNLDNEEMTSKHFDLITFSIDNVLSELLGESYTYEKVIDEIFIVYIFVFDKDEDVLNSWDIDCRNIFHKLYEFFKNNFKIDLSITIGQPFQNFEKAPDYYNEILDAFTYRYVIEQYGVLSTQSLDNMGISFVERLQKFKKDIIYDITKKDFEVTNQHLEHLYDVLRLEEEPFIMVKYYLLSIISEILLLHRNRMDSYLVDNNSSPETSSGLTLDAYLKQLSNCTTLPKTLNEFRNILKFLCGEPETAIIENANIKEEDGFIQKIKSYVKENYNDPNMNISGISDAIGLSPKYLSKLFKDATKEGLLVYINMVRIKHAEVLLQETNLTIDEIAEKTGFTNSRSFRRNFFKIVGMNPTDYRK